VRARTRAWWDWLRAGLRETAPGAGHRRGEAAGDHPQIRLRQPGVADVRAEIRHERESGHTRAASAARGTLPARRHGAVRAAMDATPGTLRNAPRQRLHSTPCGVGKSHEHG
jgi:hypothetical protein